MEAKGAAREQAGARRGPLARLPAWALGLIPLALIAAALVALLTVGGDTLGERRGPPVEDLAVEQTVLRPGEIELTLRNAGPDAVEVAQVFVNDAYVDYTTGTEQVKRLGDQTVTLDYPWQEGSPLLVTLLTSSGATIFCSMTSYRKVPARGVTLISAPWASSSRRLKGWP